VVDCQSCCCTAWGLSPWGNLWWWEGDCLEVGQLWLHRCQGDWVEITKADNLRDRLLTPGPHPCQNGWLSELGACQPVLAMVLFLFCRRPRLEATKTSLQWQRWCCSLVCHYPDYSRFESIHYVPHPFLFPMTTTTHWPWWWPSQAMTKFIGLIPCCICTTVAFLHQGNKYGQWILNIMSW